MHDNRYILDQKKKTLRQNVIDMSAQAIESLQGALNCLAHPDTGAQRAIVEGDGALNSIHHANESLGIFAIASQQPVAHDLREIVVAMWVGCELERIGDYAANIAEIRQEMSRDDLSGIGLKDVETMGGEVISMLHTAMQTYCDLDIEKAKSLESMEAHIDEAVKPLTRKLFDAMKEDPAWVEDASRMLWIVHNLERAADRCTNIAEQVIYAVTAHESNLNT